MNTFQVKTIEDIAVAYVAKSGHPASVAGKAFFELEQKVPLQGNRFYGVYGENLNEYRACVAITENNKELVGYLKKGIIQGGTYAQATLVGAYNYVVTQIGPTFDKLMTEYKRDLSRPCIEFYKRHTEVIVMLPIKN